jgi:hypothetical protein
VCRVHGLRRAFSAQIEPLLLGGVDRIAAGHVHQLEDALGVVASRWTARPPWHLQRIPSSMKGASMPATSAPKTSSLTYSRRLGRVKFHELRARIGMVQISSNPNLMCKD